MGTKLYVGGLSYEMEENALREIFSQSGTVESATIIFDRTTGRSKGFGFVEMSSEEEARKAIEALNEKEVLGRRIIVNEARPQGERSSRPKSFNRGTQGKRW